ncbi:hypothetical protein BDV34DRAFT_195937 [Aspergillus parasiticus]|uniref:Secreted protein n=1 Tax=Aspergillus parasiticus TaxID=5067 RepID=A0A5N6DJC9_ASPPA|nr:hypothetical protein BDV34DRAFT_195937 [Aspergillus parasiticus]
MLLLVSAIYWCLSYGIPSSNKGPKRIEPMLHKSIYRSSHIGKHPNSSNQILRHSRIAIERLPEEKTETPPTKTARATND